MAVLFFCRFIFWKDYKLKLLHFIYSQIDRVALNKMGIELERSRVLEGLIG